MRSDHGRVLMSSWTAILLCLLASLGLWSGRYPIDVHCLINWDLHEYHFHSRNQSSKHSPLESLCSMHMQNLRTAFWGPVDDRGHRSNHHDIVCTCLQSVYLASWPWDHTGSRNVRTWETGNGSLGNVARSYTFLLLLKPSGMVWWCV